MTAFSIEFDCMAVGTAEMAAAARHGFASQLTTLLPANTLKNADDQTVVGLSATLKAIEKCGRAADAFGDWGVIAAPRTPGRAATAASVARYEADGAWSVSPHIIPHCSLHSLAGTISQALKITGPNLGIAGMPGREAELFFAADAMLCEGNLPGLWLVMTGWDPEPLPGAGSQEPICRAVALALQTGNSVAGGSFRITWNDDFAVQHRLTSGRVAFSLESLYRALADNHPSSILSDWEFPPSGVVEYQGAAVVCEAVA